MDKVKKGLQDDYRSAGCNMIIPKASIAKNLKSIINEIMKWVKVYLKKELELKI